MTKNKKAAALPSAAQEILREQYSNGAAAQRNRVLEFLRQRGSISTIDARHLIDVMHPAARIMELRRAGHPIQTLWTHATTPEGGTHRVARYYLVHKVSEVAA